MNGYRLKINPPCPTDFYSLHPSDFLNSSQHTFCFLCGSNQIAPLKNFTRHGLLKCRHCNFVFMDKIPSVEELKLYYSNYSYSGDRVKYISQHTIKSYHKLLDEMEPYRKTNRLLDSGCGLGWFLAEAKKRGWEVYGTEFSSSAVSICSEKGINMMEGALSVSMFEKDFFDVITSIEVMEHINNPHDELKAITGLLRNGGLFYCTTPNFNSAMRYYLGADYNVIEYPEHLSYYTRSTLNRLAAMHNLKNVRFLSTGISVTRLKQSAGKVSVKSSATKSEDEMLRDNIESKRYMQIAKQFINSVLTLTNTGLTLKGYYEKSQA